MLQKCFQISEKKLHSYKYCCYVNEGAISICDVKGLCDTFSEDNVCHLLELFSYLNSIVSIKGYKFFHI